MKTIITFTMILGLGFYNISFAESGHNHKNHAHDKEKSHGHEDNLDAHKGHDDHDSHKGEKHGHSDHGDHGAPKFGKGKAIVEVKKEGKFFKLATGAIKTLKVQTIKLDSSNNKVFEIPASAVVDFQDEIGIYRRNGDWFEMVEVKLIQRGKYSAKIKSSHLAKNNQIVSQGVALLRVAHLEASGQGGQGHAH